jgi:RimJ/RimL family protein N-acetyltransferase
VDATIVRDVNVPRIETQRLVLRLWNPSDAPALAAIEKRLGRPATVDEELAHIERYVRHWNSHGYGRWAVTTKASGTLIGRIGVMYQPEWRASAVKDEIGWTLDPEYWGRGVATEGALAALGDVFDRVRLRRVSSYTDPENVASLRVMEKCGFTYEGRAEWRGGAVVWYSRDAIGRGEPLSVLRSRA